MQGPCTSSVTLKEGQKSALYSSNLFFLYVYRRPTITPVVILIGYSATLISCESTALNSILLIYVEKIQPTFL